MSHQLPHLVVDHSAASGVVRTLPVTPLATPLPLSLARRLVVEGIGTALLLAMVVGSAIMAARLASGNAALALLANSLASSTGLLALLLAFGGLSGAHFNPVVTLSLAWRRKFALSEVMPYIAVQILGACAGVMLADAMFGLPPMQIATQVHDGASLWLGEFVATFGLIAVGIACARSKPSAAPFAVAAYIAAGYWFASSSSFANPALTIARMFTNSVAGIDPVDAIAYVCAELAGGAIATLLFGWLLEEAE
jgi:glycerol uptake facilitator-like aquaporin